MTFFYCTKTEFLVFFFSFLFFPPFLVIAVLSVGFVKVLTFGYYRKGYKKINTAHVLHADLFYFIYVNVK